MFKNIVICDSDINDSLENGYSSLYNLVKAAKNYSISISIAFDVLFSVKKEDVSRLHRGIFLRDNDKILEKFDRYILNSSNEHFIPNIISRMEKYASINIEDYYIFNLPQKINIEVKKGIQIFEIQEEVDNDLLVSTAEKMMLRTYQHIRLYYSYEYECEEVDLSRTDFKFHGYVMFIAWPSFDKMLNDPVIFSQSFNQSEDGQRKILFFEINQDVNRFSSNVIFLGIYLFSPIDIFISSRHEFVDKFYVKEYIINVKNKYSRINKQRIYSKLFKDIHKRKMIYDSFYNQSTLISVRIVSNRVLAAIRGSYEEEKISNIMIFLYCFGPISRVLIYKLFEKMKAEEFSILYDNFNIDIFNTGIKHKEIYMTKGQLVILTDQ